MPTRPAIVGWRRQAGLVMFMSFPSGLGTEGEHANRCRDLLLEGAAGRSWEPARPQGTAVSCGSDLLGSGLRSVGPREATGGPGGRSFGGERSSGVTGGRHELLDARTPLAWKYSVPSQQVPGGDQQKGASPGGLLLATGKPGQAVGGWDVAREGKCYS